MQHMRIVEILSQRIPSFSFEFFPPRNEAALESLFSAIAQLKSLDPSFVSVTYGANGSTRTRTVELVKRLRGDLGIEPMAHLTCVGASRQELCSVLDELQDAHIDNVLALRGDPPDGASGFHNSNDGLRHGSELAALISAKYAFCIGAACYPEGHIESPDLESDLAFTRLKVVQGAGFLITQLFFDNRLYFDFVARSRAAGISVPIIPGIMPVTNVEQIKRFTSKIGVTIPAALLAALDERRNDAEAVVQLGVAWATLQCQELLAGGAPGIHFYTLNRSPATRAILSALRVAKPWEHK